MYLIIGSGRAAFHFARYLSLLKAPFLTWNRKNSSLEDLQIKLSRVEKVLLLISDAQIEPFAKTYLKDFPGKVIHMSGALEIPGVIGAHPLMTFGPVPYELEVYEKISFCLSPGVEFQKIFPELSNPSFSMSPENKSLYHAWAVYSGNFSTLLWQEALKGFEKIGVPTEAVAHFLQQGLKNSLESPKQALTGPLVRKDSKTMESHLNVLPEPARSIYGDFVKTYAPDIKLALRPEINDEVKL